MSLTKQTDKQRSQHSPFTEIGQVPLKLQALLLIHAHWMYDVRSWKWKRLKSLAGVRRSRCIPENDLDAMHLLAAPLRVLTRRRSNGFSSDQRCLSLLYSSEVWKGSIMNHMIRAFTFTSSQPLPFLTSTKSTMLFCFIRLSISRCTLSLRHLYPLLSIILARSRLIRNGRIRLCSRPQSLVCRHIFRQ